MCHPRAPRRRAAPRARSCLTSTPAVSRTFCVPSWARPQAQSSQTSRRACAMDLPLSAFSSCPSLGEDLPPAGASRTPTGCTEEALLADRSAAAAGAGRKAQSELRASQSPRSEKTLNQIPPKNSRARAITARAASRRQASARSPHDRLPLSLPAFPPISAPTRAYGMTGVNPPPFKPLAAALVNPAPARGARHTCRASQSRRSREYFTRSPP